MNYKRNLKMALAPVLAASLLLAGCGKTADNAPVKQNSAEKSGSELQPYEISWVFRGASQKDLNLIAEEMSKITKQKINATVKLTAIDSAAWDQQATLLLSGNEKVDLIYTKAATYSSQVAKGQVLPLDDLLKKYGQDILKSIEPDILSATKIKGQTYGVPTVRDFASFAGIVLRTDLLEKYKIDVSKIKTLNDLDPVFKTIKENEPNLTLVGPQVAGTSTLDLQVNASVDSLGEGLGVLVDVDDLKVVNLYETPLYADYLKTVRRWYQAGYISKDAATSKEGGYDLIKANKGFAAMIKGKPGNDVIISQLTGKPMTLIQLSPTLSNTYSITNTMFSIPKNSKNPERAMMLMNLMYSDKQLINLIDWGIEGKHYVKKSENTIDFPSGVDAASSGYNLRQGWMLGNQSLSYLWANEDPETWTKMTKFNKEAKKSKALGFTFNTDPVKTEIAALTNVVNQYKMGLETGTVDPDVNLPKFIAALKSAGIDKVVGEKQKQLDEWAKSAK
ncbi:ABC transporter substrate-binding protein [Paenibacillus thalictri]|uniref:Extracellular solute-binding protein n=1 Tax=Paenibacillus thalictri TaxID=2527873 RepID=A0A4Q9DW05_9BACL|nr:ABC transporter substrate-binding protein [Paenibacillus thalictri]TBL79898.1 extracellular solute-binding protein [Paenibacillus thalictri]